MKNATVALCFLLFAVVPVRAGGLTLQQVQSKIREQQQSIRSGEANQNSLQKFLEDNARAALRLQKQVRSLTAKVATLRREQIKLKKNLREARDKMNALRKDANQAALPILAVGEGGLLKVLFGRAGFGEIVLADLAMKQWFGLAAQQVRDFAAATSRAKKAQQSLDRKIVLVQSREKELQKQRSLLQARRKGTAKVLAGLRNKLSLYRQTLAGLQQEEARLRQLLKQKIRKGKVSMPAERTALAPVKIRRIRGFGHYRDQATGLKLESTGILYAAKPGTPILATAAGKVVFADWFRGYGWLVILAHDGGYFTLYAHCQELNVKENEQEIGRAHV